MSMNKDYVHWNKKAWNNKVPYHLSSKFYENNAFVKGKSSLKAPELALLGNVQDKSILHLQCHFGQDSVSLSRLGAIKVLGVDFSDKAINEAKKLAELCEQSTRFTDSDVYSFNPAGEQKFDIVFTSYGTIGWLPDLTLWAQTISRSLNNNGTFVMVDFHPFVWTFDDDMRMPTYDYFNTEAIIETTNGTYADRSAPLEDTTYSWNHSLADILQALIDAGLQLEQFKEYPYSSYNCFSNLKEIARDQFVFAHLEVQVPMMYGIRAKLNEK